MSGGEPPVYLISRSPRLPSDVSSLLSGDAITTCRNRFHFERAEPGVIVGESAVDYEFDPVSSMRVEDWISDGCSEVFAACSWR